MNFNRKTIVVTGAGGGVGRQLVLQLLAKGARVAAVDVNPQALEETRLTAIRQQRGSYNADQAPVTLTALSLHTADITKAERVKALPEEILAAHGGAHHVIDGLINNAGIIQPFLTLNDLNDDSIERLMNINFYGMMHMTRAFVPYLAEAEEAVIGNVSSMGGFLPVPGQSVYGASKAAVKIATEALRMELSRTGIAVSLIIPGGIETDIKKNSGLGDEGATAEDKAKAGLKLTSPEEAARTIIAGIEKNKAKILIGKDVKAMDFLYRFAPELAGKLINRVMSANHGGIMNERDALRKRTAKSA